MTDQLAGLRAMHLLRTAPAETFTPQCYADVCAALQHPLYAAEPSNACTDTKAPVDAPDKPAQRATEGVQ